MKSGRNMNKRRIGILVATVAAVAVLLTAGIGSAQTWPEKGKLLYYYIAGSPGGGSDINGRAMSTFLEKELGVKIVIINKPGGGSQIGVTEFMAKSGTDGYTMVMANAPVNIPPYIDPDRKASYNYNKDIILAVNYAFSPCAVAVKKGGKYKSLKDLIDAARANPSKISGVVQGPLVQNDLAMALLEKAAGVKFAHQFIDSPGEQRACLLGGHCDALFDNDFELIAGQKSGQIETLAIFDKQPVAALPGVPTAESLGYKVYMSAGYGLGFKTGTPKEVVDTVVAAVERAAKTPEMQAMFNKLGLGLRVMKGQEFADYWKYQEGVVTEVIAGMKKEGKK